MAYLLIKAFHLSTVAFWLFGIFSEDRLHRRIKATAFMAALGSGMVLLYFQGLPLSQGWLHGKMTAMLILGLYAFHPHIFPRSLRTNFFPAFLAVWSVVMVVVKPF